MSNDNWMIRQFKDVIKEVKSWPKWMHIAAGLEETNTNCKECGRKNKCSRNVKH